MAVLFLVVIVSTHLLALSRLIFFPYPELFIYPYLTSQGLIPYKEILDQHFPGLMFFPINLATLGMTSPDIARIWHFAIIIITHFLLFISALKLTKSKSIALIANFFYFLFHPYLEGYVLWIDTFIPLLFLPAFILLNQWLVTKKDKVLLLSGLFIGIALVFKQVVIVPLALVNLYILVKSRSLRSTLIFNIGVLIPVILLIYYILSLGIWDDFFYWTFTFNTTVFNEMGRTSPTIPVLVRILPLFILPVLALSTLSKKHKEKVWLLTLFLLGSLIFAYARFDYVHLHPALPFVALSIAFAAGKTTWKMKTVLLVPLVILGCAFMFRTFQRYYDDSILFYGKEELQIVEKVNEYADEGDSVFAFATITNLNQMTRTLPPGNIFVFPFPWFSVAAEDRVLEGLMEDPPKVVVRDKNSTTGGVNMNLFMPRINSYVEDNYTTVDFIGRNEIMIPR